MDHHRPAAPGPGSSARAHGFARGRGGGLGRGLVLGRVAGVPVRLSGSWFLLTLVIVLGYGGHLDRVFPWLGAGAWLAALGFALLLALSVGLHELAHALTAQAFGWQAQEIVLSLMGGHTAFRASRESPGRSALVSLAGPSCNLLLAGLGWSGMHLVPVHGVPGLVLHLATSANLLVGLFNLLPGIPLDGGHAVAALVWKATGSRRRGVVVASWLGCAVAGVIVLWVVLTPARASLGTVVLATMIAFFLFDGARQILRSEALRTRVEGLSAGALARPALLRPASEPIRTVLAAAREAFGPSAGTAFPGDPTVVLLGTDGLPVGVLDHEAARAAQARGHSSAPSSAAMRTVLVGEPVPAELRGQRLVAMASEHPGALWPVTGMAEEPASPPAAAPLFLLAETDVRQALHEGRRSAA